MKLSVPFIPEKSYTRFLAKHKNVISSIYFPLSDGPPFDARVKMKKAAADTETLARILAPLAHVKKYILMNTRFVAPTLYLDTDALNRFLDNVSRLHKAVGIQGIVIADLYLANALDRTGHPVIHQLEAVPGVNAMLDSIEKVTAWVEILGQTRFAPPGRLIVDRSLNRRPEQLQILYLQVKSAHPKICLEVLANEGCIFHCPFKPPHDAHIALSNTGLVKESTWLISQRLGCHSYFTAQPHKFLKSPFIRPEDTVHYKGMADTVKLSGRTLGPEFLKQCIQAYAAGSFKGNILKLMDASQFMSQRIHLSNPGLGTDFFKTLTTCTKECKDCRICHTIFKKAAHFKPAGLPRYEDMK